MAPRLTLFISVQLLILHFLVPLLQAQGTSEEVPSSSLVVSPLAPSTTPTTLLLTTRLESGPSSTLETITHVSPTSSTALETSLPTSTQDSGSPLTDEDDSRTGIVNYYFLLLAVLVFIVIVLYLSWMRSRRKRRARYQDTRQNALHRDVSRWRGTRWIYGYRRDNREEGLNERGEAPPPYMPSEPHPVFHEDEHQRESPAVLLRELPAVHQKPPDYVVQHTATT